MNPVYSNSQDRKLNGTCKNSTFEKFKKYYRRCRYAVMSKEKHHWTDEEKNCLKERRHVWYKLHKETVEENVEIWNEIKKLLVRYSNIELSVIVFPFCPWFINEHDAAISEMKKIFDKNIDVPPDNVRDYFREYMEFPEYFSDDCHLNLLGAYDFSRKINGMLRGKR